MSSEMTILVFDILIIFLAIYGIFSAVRMKNKGIPSTILVSKQELVKMKNTKEFCDKMSQPTGIFSAMAFMYGIIDILNQYVWKVMYLDILSIICFLIVCAWFVRELRKEKEKHL